MAKNRYGRNQKRQHRERIAELESQRAEERQQRQMLHAEVHRVTQYAEDVKKALSRLNPLHPLQPPEHRGYVNGHLRIPVRESLREIDEIAYGPGYRAAPMAQIALTLNRLRYIIDELPHNDPEASRYFQSAVHLVSDDARVGYQISDEALVLNEGLPSYAAQELIEMIERELLEGAHRRLGIKKAPSI